MRVSGPAGVVRPVEAPVCPQIKSTHTACAQHITQGDTLTRSMGLPLHSAHTRRVARAHARTHSHNNTSHNTRKRKGVVDGQHDFRQIAYTLKRARTRAFTYIHTPIHIHTHTHTHLPCFLGSPWDTAWSRSSSIERLGLACLSVHLACVWPQQRFACNCLQRLLL